MPSYSTPPCELAAMAPDAGMENRASDEQSRTSDDERHAINRQEVEELLATRAAQGQNFTIRSLVLGLLIGVVICFSNTYFGLQTGWVSGMAMPSALLGFAWFKAMSRYLSYPFTPVENVLVQTVAGSVGTMPLGCGFVGVIPALEFLLKPSESPGEGSGVHLSLGKLIVWALGICFFGVVFAVPLRKEVIIRENLKFPSGKATALMISVLHGGEKDAHVIKVDNRNRDNEVAEDEQRLMAGSSESPTSRTDSGHRSRSTADGEDLGEDARADWKSRIRLLTISFGLSAFYVRTGSTSGRISCPIYPHTYTIQTVVSYFIPRLHDIPLFGMYLADTWLWTLNPSPAYVGQGIIMGPATTLHMLLGAVVGWGILSPLAKDKGWAPGPVSDWETGSKGWIVWISLAIMLADSIISMGWLVLRPTITFSRVFVPRLQESIKRGTVKDDFRGLLSPTGHGYDPVNFYEDGRESPDYGAASNGRSKPKPASLSQPDAPPEHLVGWKVTVFGLILSLAACVGAVRFAFADLLSYGLILLALLLALILSIMGVRALGETDLNPVSGISKITQLIFALVTPKGSPNAVIINLVAGAISESGALQAGVSILPDPPERLHSDSILAVLTLPGRIYCKTYVPVTI